MASTGEVFEILFESCVRGFHVYQDVWTPLLGELLSCTRELGNAHDIFAVRVTKEGVIVGHVPKKISSTCSLFISTGGVISCEVTDPHRRYSRDLAQGGLEIPCVFKFQGTQQLIDKANKLLAISNKSNDDQEDTAKEPESSTVGECPAEVFPEVKQIKVEETLISSAPIPVLPDAKRIKVEELEDEQIVWVVFSGTRIQLYNEDKLMIEEQRRLNDRHINFAQAMLRSQFPHCDGLKNTLLQRRVKLSIANKIVQILHTRSDHWVVISNIYSSESELSLYDTVYNDIDDSTKALIRSMFEEDITVTIAQVQKQTGDVDCGVYSVAIATSLLYGLSPGPYVQSLLRPHMIDCFEKKSIQPFP